MTYHQKHFIAICMATLLWLLSIPRQYGVQTSP